MKEEKKLNKQLLVIAGVLIHNGKVLLNVRSEPELPDAHLKWELPGGKVDFGELPEDAVIREFNEETGREIRVTKLLPNVWVNYWEYPWGKQQTFCLIYLCELVKDGEPATKDHHVARTEWINLEEVKNLPSLPKMNEILEEAKKQLAL